MSEKKPQNRRLGYARVSPVGQTLAAQLDRLRKAGCSQIFREKVTGARPDRRCTFAASAFGNRRQKVKEDWWDRKAGESQRAGLGDYPTEGPTRDDAYRIALHTRQDVVLIVSYLSSLNKQVFQIKLMVCAVAALFAYTVFR